MDRRHKYRFNPIIDIDPKYINIHREHTMKDMNRIMVETTNLINKNTTLFNLLFHYLYKN